MNGPLFSLPRLRGRVGEGAAIEVIPPPDAFGVDLPRKRER
jgi:hypothetical protein